MDALKSLPKTTITATLQCGGNRRREMNKVEPTSGIAWGPGAISTARWGGVRLRDLLLSQHPELRSLRDAEARGIKHVVFEGADGMEASIPLEKAMSEYGDVLMAYEMNGAPVTHDHGFPVRAVVPGHVGVRNVKVGVGRAIGVALAAPPPGNRRFRCSAPLTPLAPPPSGSLASASTERRPRGRGSAAWRTRGSRRT